MTVAWEPRGCGSQEDLLSHSPKWKEMVPPESLNTLLSLQKKGLEIILMQGCHCQLIFGSIVARHPPWHMQPPPGLTAWEEPLGLDFSPYLCPCLGATSTTVHGGHDPRYPLNNASVRTVNSYRNPGHVVLGTAPFFFPIPFLCAPLPLSTWDLQAGPPTSQHMIQVSPLILLILPSAWFLHYKLQILCLIPLRSAEGAELNRVHKLWLNC